MPYRFIRFFSHFLFFAFTLAKKTNYSYLFFFQKFHNFYFFHFLSFFLHFFGPLNILKCCAIFQDISCIQRKDKSRLNVSKPFRKVSKLCLVFNKLQGNVYTLKTLPPNHCHGKTDSKTVFKSSNRDTMKKNKKEFIVNPLLHSVPKWSDTLLRSCSICCKIFKVCLAILGHYVFKC